MNDIINALCIGMLCGSFVPLLQSLTKTMIAYKKNKELKNNLTKSKDYERKRIEEILVIQKRNYKNFK